MSSKQNIEDLFRSGLEDYSVNPSGKVWSGINKKLAGPRFEALYRNAFNGFKISPSEQLWRRIAAVVWFNKFIHFTPFSFNIYYLAIITSAVIGTVVTVDNNTDLDFVHFEQKSVIPVNSEKDTANFIKMPFAEVLAENYTEWELTYNQKYSEKNVETAEVVVKDEKNGEKTKIPVSVTVNNKNTGSLPDEITSQPSEMPAEDNSLKNTMLNRGVLGETKNNEAVNIASSEAGNKANSETGEITDYSTEKTTDPGNNEVKSVAKYLIPPRLKVTYNHMLTYKPQWSELADIAFEGIPELDVITHDTIGYNYLGDPVVVEKSWFTAEAFFSPYMCDYNYTLLNQELESNYDFYSANKKPGFTYSAGLGFSYTNNRFRVETGVAYHILNGNINQETACYDTITSYTFNYFEAEKWNYDTTMILDLDEYLQGNIVYIPYVDSTLVTYTDSIETAYQDSVLVNKLILANNTYHIIDIPVIAGYEFTYGKFSVTPKAGIITGLVVKNSGTAFNIMDGKIYDASLLPANRVLFDYYAAVNLQYRISEHTSIFIEPHIRGDINSMYKETYAISEKTRKYGIKTGISFRF